MNLDDIATRRATAADPTLFKSEAAEPACLGEFQHVLGLLDAIKAELNRVQASPSLSELA
jgi:hypothetical protein